MKKFPAALLFSAAVALVSCKKETGNSNNQPGTQPIAPNGFNFSTTKEVSIDVQLLTNDDKPLSGVLVNVYSSLADKNGKSLLSVLSSNDGSVKATVSIPAYIETLYIDPAYIGLMRNAKAVVNGISITGTIGGSTGFSGDIVADEERDLPPATGASGRGIANKGNNRTKYEYVPYDANGRPTNLVSPSDVISSTLLSFINTSLPESKPVPIYHPDFLTASAINDIAIVKKADVWITFVSEGAGYYNTLGYYTYPTGNPPLTEDDIDTINVIMPNASLSGSGGAMRSGDKIYLGRFNTGVSIGFVLLQDAWTSNNRKVNTGGTKFFTHDYLNTTETNAKNRRHAVLLYDDVNKLFLTGFEDQIRTGGGSDEDFNDLIFYTSSNPVDAISTKNVNLIDKPNDADGDGVTDVNDKFPTDAARAYIQYYPAEDIWGTISFEDLWPATGDYDLNDMVVGYRYKYIKNAQNNTVELYGDYTLRGVGASFINGFGVQLPIASNKVRTVTGQKLIANYITTNANGTEAGQTNAVIIPFDDTRALHPTGGFVNVTNGTTYIHCDTARVYAGFITPLTSTELTASVYNPFLISNQRRSYEVHLAGHKPTDKVDKTLFGTAQDNSNTSTNRYYLSAKNWPWALSFVEDFDYPTEANNISMGYLYFLDWAQSGGTQNAEWYKNIADQRNINYLFRK